MSNLFFVILLAVGFGVWKVLDYFQLPNTFSILLLILTALSRRIMVLSSFCGAAKTSSSSRTCRTTFW
ncbi:hypothetical protein ACDK42_01680 [Haemophilus influenzae]